jgi:hypothetical protein
LLDQRNSTVCYFIELAALDCFVYRANPTTEVFYVRLADP